MAKEEWKIDRVESYYYHSGRNSNEYVEVTFWYNPKTLERKETSRRASCYSGGEYKLPEWAKTIKERRRSLESDRVW